MQSLKADNATNLSKFEYGYNTRDVRTSMEKTIGAATMQKVNYTYDQIDQLTKELSTEAQPTLDKEYSYDAMGNRTASAVANASTSYTSNNLNQITQTSLGGNNTAITYDANGNTVQQGNKTFGYNDADQLTSVVIPNTKKSEFVYDSDGRKRISKEFTWQNGAWVQSDETRFVYDGMDLVQERGADGTVKASYVRDGNIGGVLSRTTNEGTFYYHYDGGGNVVALTDSNENIVAQYSYDAFGNTLSATGAQAEKNPFRFSSKYYDGDTGLYDYGYRHYDSNLGRWINRDPIRENGGLNIYGFVKNKANNSLDAYGLAEWIVRDRKGPIYGHAYIKFRYPCMGTHRIGFGPGGDRPKAGTSGALWKNKRNLGGETTDTGSRFSIEVENKDPQFESLLCDCAKKSSMSLPNYKFRPPSMYVCGSWVRDTWSCATEKQIALNKQKGNESVRQHQDWLERTRSGNIH